MSIEEIRRADGTPAITLRWVIVEGRPRHVSDFAALAPSRRPAAHCPECGRRLTLKLGDVRVHHAAHAPSEGNMCPATAPETVLHINTKCHIAAQMLSAISGSAHLRIAVSCAAAHAWSASGSPAGARCHEVDTRAWIHGWDAVDLELRVARGGTARRPDIVVSRGTRPIASIEVRVTHAVDDEKAEALQALGVPWIEVRADSALTDGPGAWTIDRALSVERVGGESDWRCVLHARAHEARMEARQRALTDDIERARHTAVIVAARVVDIHAPAGDRTRHLYSVTEHRTDGAPTAVAMARDGREIARVDRPP